MNMKAIQTALDSLQRLAGRGSAVLSRQKPSPKLGCKLRNLSYYNMDT